MARIDYEIEDRGTLLESLRTAGKQVLEDVTINLDESGRLTTCYCIVEDAPATVQDEANDMREALDMLGIVPEGV